MIMNRSGSSKTYFCALWNCAATFPRSAPIFIISCFESLIGPSLTSLLKHANKYATTPINRNTFRANLRRLHEFGLSILHKKSLINSCALHAPRASSLLCAIQCVLSNAFNSARRLLCRSAREWGLMCRVIFASRIIFQSVYTNDLYVHKGRNLDLLVTLTEEATRSLAFRLANSRALGGGNSLLFELWITMRREMSQVNEFV
jgi:hypothetical protein